MEAGHITARACPLQAGAGVCLIWGMLFPVCPPQAWLIYNGPALSLCCAGSVSLEMKRFTLDIGLETWNLLQISRIPFEKATQHANLNSFRLNELTCPTFKKPVLGVMIEPHFPRTIKLLAVSKAAKVNDLACKNCGVINQAWEERTAGCACAITTVFTSHCLLE